MKTPLSLCAVLFARRSAMNYPVDRKGFFERMRLIGVTLSYFYGSILPNSVGESF